MTHYHELDNEILSLGRPGSTPGISRADATVFLHAMRKLAAEGAPAPDQDLVEHQTEVATGEEATPEEAAVHTQAGAPDTSGHLEGEFAVPVEQVVQTLAQIVSNSMRQHTAYSFYGEMMRDLGRGELAELFDEQGAGEIEEMKYFLRRMSVLMPGGVPIPVAPTPVPSSDVGQALQYLIAGEQQAIVLFKTLRSMLGENPMKFTIESIMGDAQEHLDKLWQYMPATEAPPQQAAAAKVAAVLRKIANATQVQGVPAPPEPPAPPAPPQAPQQAVPVGPPGSEPLSVVLGREQLLQSAQLMAENQDLRQRADFAAQQQLQQQQAVESLTAENQSLQQQSQMAADQAHMATEQAQQMSEQAAQQADAKMRLSIRIQQLRQNLADIVSQDPVQEEGVGFGEQAGPGTVMTSQQQAAMAQQAAAMDPSGGAGGAPTEEAAEEQQEAANAQQEAQQQTAQAQQKTKEDSSKKPSSGGKDSKGGTTVSVKTSSLVDAVRKPLVGAGHAMGEGIAQHLEHAGGEAVRGGMKALRERAGEYAKNPKVVGGAALAGGLYAGSKLHGMKKQHERDDTQKKILAAVERMANKG